MSCPVYSFSFFLCSSLTCPQTQIRKRFHLVSNRATTTNKKATTPRRQTANCLFYPWSPRPPPTRLPPPTPSRKHVLAHTTFLGRLSPPFFRQASSSSSTSHDKNCATLFSSRRTFLSFDDKENEGTNETTECQAWHTE